MDQAAEKSASTDAILIKLREIFRAELEDEGLNVQLDTKQTDLKAWDSLAQIRLVSAVESEFEFQFSLSEIEHINSVRQFVDLIQQRAL
jgi:acyl carrier protein